MNQKILINYSFTPEYSVRVGSGQGKYGIIDNAYRTRLNAQRTEVICIPGTSVKGRIRNTFQRLIPIFYEDHSNLEIDIFGNAKREGWARFSDLQVSDVNNTLKATQTSTTIDRFRKTAKAKTLRVEEFVTLTNQEAFSGTIEGYIGETEELIPELVYLLLAIINTDKFGGSKSVGFGSGKVNILSVKIGKKSYTYSQIEDYLTNLVARG